MLYGLTAAATAALSAATGYAAGHFGYGEVSCDECGPRRKKIALICAGSNSVSILALQYIAQLAGCPDTLTTTLTFVCIASPLLSYLFSRVVKAEVFRQEQLAAKAH